ncbi:hypothetical protein PoB_002717500 [Plakobranchus ocellatus]|uniref:Uncharacterized protein n=1 Tax=Plakobranchus ocellatus TaxID=259542 RepID=A0AAV3ZXR8_9GAST|nr:hypothetical protein PoB_002717500 [Plakobranchus ocellatus]
MQTTRGVGSTVACKSALRSARTLLSRVRAQLLAPWPDGGPESLRSPCCGLAIYKNSLQTTGYQYEHHTVLDPETALPAADQDGGRKDGNS